MLKNKDNSASGAWWAPAVKLFGQLAGWLVAPIIAALFLGNFIDNRYDCEPYGLIGSVAVAFIVTNVGLVKNILAFAKNNELKAPENSKSPYDESGSN